jgi:hypothetical protein
MKQKLITILIILAISVFPIYYSVESNIFLITVLVLIAATAVLIAYTDKKQH